MCCVCAWGKEPKITNGEYYNDKSLSNKNVFIDNISLNIVSIDKFGDVRVKI